MIKLVWITPDAENLMSYCARVSNPSNQNNFETAPKLLAYCIKHKHWSVFEQANMGFEIETTRAISAQMIRHKSINFQEFSQRYSKATEFEILEARRQDSKNRQNSISDMSDEDKEWFYKAQKEVIDLSQNRYDEALVKGIAKEQARFLLPMSTKTKLYANGTVRSWIHYVEVRQDPSTQKEHRILALQIKEIMKKELPNIAEALGW